jgi:hypothetical protein
MILIFTFSIYGGVLYKCLPGCLESVILGDHLRECHILPYQTLYSRIYPIPNITNYYRYKLFKLASANLDIKNFNI